EKSASNNKDSKSGAKLQPFTTVSKYFDACEKSPGRAVAMGVGGMAIGGLGGVLLSAGGA
ncbi:MAG: hypothetical protein QM532_03115, partial [Cyanobium sp. MAG06]|nr:hypothetical protein [Cyanobium sp. MAG06]